MYNEKKFKKFEFSEVETMATIGERIRDLRKANDLTQTEFGKLFGIGKTTVSSWETGNSCPSDDIKLAISQYFNISTDYLLGLKDSTHISSSQFSGFVFSFEQSKEFESIVSKLSEKSIYDVSADTNISVDRLEKIIEMEIIPTPSELVLLARYLDCSVDYLLGIESNLAPMDAPLTYGTKIKVLGKVPAGIPIEAVECVIDEIDISKEMAEDEYEYLGLLVSGDSMYPEYLDGDIVIIRKQSTAETGDDVVAYVNGYDATLKRLQRMTGGIRLKALNPQYESKFYSNEDIKNLPVSILGVVVEMRRTKK